MKIFTVLMLALTTMPCFADNPSTMNQLNALVPNLLNQTDAIARQTTNNLNTQEEKQKANALSAQENTTIINDNKNNVTDDAKNTANQHLEKDKELAKSLSGKKADAAAAAESAAQPESDVDTDAKKVEEAKKKYEDAKANEQSMANKTLTALTTAATGIGGMELARGLSEQKADKDAENSMAAYIATMRCTYGDGKQVKAGPDEIELPGGNNQQLMNLRAEYFALAADLKERKTALGLKPGIESEEILDKAATGLYDDETKGIDSGAYASLYRAQMLGSDADQAKIDAEQKASKNRVIAGAVVGGVGVVGGIVGNSLINGKLGELIKNGKNCDAMKEFVKQEENALKSLKDCLKNAGVKDTNKLTLDSMNPLYPSLLSVNAVNCKTDLTTAKDKNITDLFNVSGKTNEEIVKHMIDKLGAVATGKLLGVTISETVKNQEITAATKKIEEKATVRYQQFEDAQKKDEESGCKLGVKTGKISDTIKETLSSQIQLPSAQ